MCVFTLLQTQKHNISGNEDGIVPSLGKIEEFETASTNSNHYLECLEQYFITNRIPVDAGERFKCRATLISVISSKAYDIILDLCSPEAPSEKTCDDLATIFKGHFAPEKLVIAERYRFHNCIQCKGESVSTFATNFKHLTSTCNFSTHLNVCSVDFTTRRSRKSCEPSNTTLTKLLKRHLAKRQPRKMSLHSLKKTPL